MDSTEKKNLQEHAAQLLSRWRESGQSMRRFCLEQQISYYTFRDWHRKERGIVTPARKRKAGFVPVTLPAITPMVGERIEITYPTGVAIKLPVATKVEKLRALLTLR